MDTIIISVVTAVFASTGFWAFITGILSGRDAQKKLLVGLAHDRIVCLGEKYIERDGVTTDELEDLEKYLYKPYKEMGGNGTAETIMHKCHSLPIIAADEAARRDKEL